MYSEHLLQLYSFPVIQGDVRMIGGRGGGGGAGKSSPSIVTPKSFAGKKQSAGKGKPGTSFQESYSSEN